MSSSDSGHLAEITRRSGPNWDNTGLVVDEFSADALIETDSGYDGTQLTAANVSIGRVADGNVVVFSGDRDSFCASNLVIWDSDMGCGHSIAIVKGEITREILAQ